MTENNCLVLRPSKKQLVVKNLKITIKLMFNLDKEVKLLERLSAKSKSLWAAVYLKLSKNRIYFAIKGSIERRKESQNEQSLRDERLDSNLSNEPLQCQESTWLRRLWKGYPCYS